MRARERESQDLGQELCGMAVGISMLYACPNNVFISVWHVGAACVSDCVSYIFCAFVFSYFVDLFLLFVFILISRLRDIKYTPFVSAVALHLLITAFCLAPFTAPPASPQQIPA